MVELRSYSLGFLRCEPVVSDIPGSALLIHHVPRYSTLVAFSKASSASHGSGDGGVRHRMIRRSGCDSMLATCDARRLNALYLSAGSPWEGLAFQSSVRSARM